MSDKKQEIDYFLALVGGESMEDQLKKDLEKSTIKSKIFLALFTELVLKKKSSINVSEIVEVTRRSDSIIYRNMRMFYNYGIIQKVYKVGNGSCTVYGLKDADIIKKYVDTAKNCLSRNMVK